MTPAQDKDSADIRERFSEKQESKYLAGAIEHGGNIWDMSLEQLINEAEAEHIDGFTYVCHIRKKSAELIEENERLKERVNDLERMQGL